MILLACSSVLALKPSSQPALQPASMQKRLHTLLHRPSRPALADVLHGPYPPDDIPAYLRVVPVLIVACMTTNLLWFFFSNLVQMFKEITTRLNVDFDFCLFLGLNGLNCERACVVAAVCWCVIMFLCLGSLASITTQLHAGQIWIVDS